ncbi:site-specific integrase [Leptolyngbya sp. FACHB-36]|uniref:site-specific integrase n=1 Tax=Leptolyngbya sp. FACHB-36 TaxID=2692808 RepID=UPI00168142B0|nr:site-specific integrase [Leptolyngbya sp. FACHB-36]MBD2019217.1 site-specific integrase [Leptolyngbya sp. FACHB-36]
MAKGKLTLEAINERLRAARVGVVVRQKGNRLYLRATLPPKPNSGKKQSHQQDVALGTYANPAGLERAEAEARKLGGLLACREFDWKVYLGDAQGTDARTCGEWVERFKRYCLETNLQRDSPEAAELLWRKRYYNSALKWLPDRWELSASVLISVAQRSKPNSRSRQVACQVLQQFAKFADVEVDLKPYVGNYSPKKVVREIPRDEVIVESIERLSQPAWRCLYGLMATYGLRDHEVFFTALEWRDGGLGNKILVARVTDGKTGAREIYPFYPEWVEQWQLWDLKLPRLTARINQDYGERVARAFKRAGMPFAPYDLRHAYAIRVSVVFKLPVAVAAAYMGHSPTLHWETYNRWISQEQHQRVYEGVLLDENRPKAP